MQIGKMVSLFILPLGNPEICQNPPTCGQDDLVLSPQKILQKKFSQKNPLKRFSKNSPKNTIKAPKNSAKKFPNNFAKTS
jgi:hypothetical protein